MPRSGRDGTDPYFSEAGREKHIGAHQASALQLVSDNSQPRSPELRSLIDIRHGGVAVDLQLCSTVETQPPKPECVLPSGWHGAPKEDLKRKAPGAGTGDVAIPCGRLMVRGLAV